MRASKPILKTAISLTRCSALMLPLLGLGLMAPPATAQTTELGTIAFDGLQGNNDSGTAMISSNGRYLAFDSIASNLVPGDTNGASDVFVRDLQTGAIERVSVSSTSQQGDGPSYLGGFSADGRYVVITALANNLVPNDVIHWDVLIHDRQTHQTALVSTDSNGVQTPGNPGGGFISDDGRYVVYRSDGFDSTGTQTPLQIYVKDLQTGSRQMVSVSPSGQPGNGYSYRFAISADGRFVAFMSVASNLIPNDMNNVGAYIGRDIFVRDLIAGTTELISVSSDGTQANADCYGGVSISADGRYVAFGCYANNLVPGDTDWISDIFVHDRQTGATSRVSVATDGTPGNADTFESAISRDGQFVAFTSEATNLVAGDTNSRSDVFLFDRSTLTTERISVANDNSQGNDLSYMAVGGISADDRYVAFGSKARNLVPNDSNNRIDIFVRDRGPGDVPNSTVASAGPDQAVNEGVDVALDGSGSSDPDGDAITYYWTQTGGPPVALGNPTSPTPTFRSPFVTGTQTLTFELAVTDALSNTASDFVDISVISTNDPPVADAGPNGTVKEGSARMLDGSASWDNNGQTVYYQWGQVSGPAVTLNNDTTATPTFVAPGGTAGQSVTFALVVTDGYEPSDPDTVTIAIVENSPPVADAGVDQTKDEGSAVSLDGTASSDPDIGDSLSYAWQQTAGPAVTLANGTTAVPSFSAPAVSSPTALTFELTVTDNDPITPKSDTDSVVINVRDVNAPPSCDLAVASAPKLWPPDHKTEAVAINGVTDSDSESEDVTLTIGGVTQDEPLNGTGDGDSSPDAMIVNGNALESVMIRRERAGDKNGRVYVVSFTASDGFESCNGSVKVTVPHSRNGTDAVDSGQTVNSTQP